MIWREVIAWPSSENAIYPQYLAKLPIAVPRSGHRLTVEVFKLFISLKPGSDARYFSEPLEGWWLNHQGVDGHSGIIFRRY